MSRSEKSRRDAFAVQVLGFLAETMATAVIAALVTLVVTNQVDVGAAGALIVLMMVGVFVLLGIPVAGIRESVEQARNERAGTARTAQLQDVTVATSDVLAEQADVLAEVRALRAEIAQMRRPWWKRWRHVG